jgi:hypothetical protein
MYYNPFLDAATALTCPRARTFYVDTALEHTRKTVFSMIMLSVAAFVLGGKFRLFCDRVLPPSLRFIWLRCPAPVLSINDDRKDLFPDPWDEFAPCLEPVSLTIAVKTVAEQENKIVRLLCPAAVSAAPVEDLPKRTRKSNPPKKPTAEKSPRSTKNKIAKKTAAKTKENLTN